MRNTFYISFTDTSPAWYQLTIKDTHFVVSCGSDFNNILDTLTSYVLKYRTRARLNEVLDHMEYGAQVSPTTFSARSSWYDLHGHVYEDIVKDTVDLALKKLRDEEKSHSPLKKVRSLLTKRTTSSLSPAISEKDVEKEDTTTVLPKRPPKVLNKKKVLLS